VIHRRRRTSLGAILLVVLLSGACGGDGRPGADAWTARWDEAVATIPRQSELGTPPDTELCNSTLVYLREVRNDLIPTPDPAIDDVVTAWIRLAEDAFYECPPDSTEIPDFDFAYRELGTLEAEVEAALAAR
jgi:hypothetical protein